MLKFNNQKGSAGSDLTTGTAATQQATQQQDSIPRQGSTLTANKQMTTSGAALGAAGISDYLGGLANGRKESSSTAALANAGSTKHMMGATQTQSSSLGQSSSAVALAAAAAAAAAATANATHQQNSLALNGLVNSSSSANFDAQRQQAYMGLAPQDYGFDLTASSSTNNMRLPISLNPASMSGLNPRLAKKY